MATERKGKKTALVLDQVHSFGCTVQSVVPFSRQDGGTEM